MIKVTTIIIMMAITLSLMLTENSSADSVTFIFEDTSSLSNFDSPINTRANNFYYKDLEDGFASTLGIAIDGGVVHKPNRFMESVFAKYTALNGRGSVWRPQGIDGITFNFDADILIGIPEVVGFAWTYGNSARVFRTETFNLDGVSILEIVFGREDNLRPTAADRFLELQNDEGFAAIRPTTNSNIKVDYLYFASLMPIAVSIVLGLVGLSGVIVAMRFIMLSKN